MKKRPTLKLSTLSTGSTPTLEPQRAAVLEEHYPNGPVLIDTGLYLGSESCAQNTHLLKALGITTIISVAKEIAYKNTHGRSDSGICFQNLKYHSLPWSHCADISTDILATIELIESATMDGRVLVHCQQGVSRSAALVIAYLIQTRQWSLVSAYDYVKSRSPCISPNMVLVSQLASLEHDLKSPL